MTISNISYGGSNSITNNTKNQYIADKLGMEGGESIALKYSRKSRKIWIEGNGHSIYKIVHHLEKNANPELVGSEDSIRFTSRQSFRHNDVQYFGITYSERSMRGTGGGECGAGVEEYFVAYRIDSHKNTKELFKLLIGSCIEGKILDTGDGNNNDYSITAKGSTIEFRWITYPGTDLYMIGRYDFIENSINYEEIAREESYKQ